MNLVSVIITTYNRPINILKRAVESVVNQSYSNIEIIVVNDCPNDRQLSQDIEFMLHSYQTKIQYFVHDTNGGACKARNTGLKHANGVYVAFLDDDDEWMPDKILLQVSEMLENVSLVYCSSIQVYGEGNEKLYIPHYPSSNQLKEILKKNYIGSSSFPLLRTEDVLKVGGFDEKIVSCQDYDLWIRILKLGTVRFIKKPLVKYHISSDSTFKRSNKKYVDGDMYLLDKHERLYRECPDALSYHLNDMAIKMLLSEHDLKLYFKYKKRALSNLLLNKYNFFLVPIKIFNKIMGK